MGVLILAFAAGGVYYFLKVKKPEATFCTMDVKICPDGSSVGRSGPNCEFAVCPSPKPTSANINCLGQKDSKIDSQLTQLILAEDPAKFAESSGLSYKDGKTRAVIETGEKIDLSKINGVVVETQSTNLIQALIPIDQFCNIKSLQGVLLIRVPMKPQPL